MTSLHDDIEAGTVIASLGVGDFIDKCDWGDQPDGLVTYLLIL